MKIKTKLDIAFYLFFLIALIIGLISTIINTIGLTKNALTLILHESEIGEYEILYPSEWKLIDTSSGNRGDKTVITNIDESFFLQTKVRVRKKFFATNDLFLVEDWGRVISNDIGSRKELSSIDLPIHGKNAILVDYIQERYSIFGNHHCYDLFLINNSDGYIFTFCTSESRWESIKNIFKEMINSITLL